MSWFQPAEKCCTPVSLLHDHGKGTLKQKIISSQSSPSSLEPKLQSSEHLSWWLTMRAHKKSVVHFSSWKKATYSRRCNTLVLFGATLAGLYSYLLSLFVSIQKAWLWQTHTVGYVKYWSEQPWDNPGATRNQKGDPEKGKRVLQSSSNGQGMMGYITLCGWPALLFGQPLVAVTLGCPQEPSPLTAVSQLSNTCLNLNSLEKAVWQDTVLQKHRGYARQFREGRVLLLPN